MLPALEFVYDGTIPIQGPGVGSVGFSIGPLSHWLSSIPFLFTNDILYVYVMVGLFFVVSLIIYYVMLRLSFGWEVAVLSLPLLSYNASLINRTTGVTNDSFMPLFLISFYFSLFQCFVHRRHIFLPFLLFFLAAIIQLHASTWAFLPMTIALCFLYTYFYPYKIETRYYLIGFFLFFFLHIPQIIFWILSPSNSASLYSVTQWIDLITPENWKAPDNIFVNFPHSGFNVITS